MNYFYGPKGTEIDAEIVHETEKAVLLRTEDVILRDRSSNDEYTVTAWIPKKLINGKTISQTFIPQWKFEKYI